MDIEDWRRQIDEIDLQVLTLLSKRVDYSIKIGEIKEKANLPIYSPERETWIINRMIEENAGPLTPAGVRRIFERIIDECRRVEKEICLKRDKE